MDEALSHQVGFLSKQKRWMPSAEAFARLLHWLDGGTDSEGQKYVEMRRRLTEYFDRKNCQSPDDLADETLNRVMKWLEAQGKEHNAEPAKICYTTARFVFYEYLRQPTRQPDSIDEMPDCHQPSADPRRIGVLEEAETEKDKRLACLRKCSQQLPADDRDLIIHYYYGEQRVKLDNRKALAAERGMTANALSIRACRIRDKLRDCVSRCVNGDALKDFSQIVLP